MENNAKAYFPALTGVRALAAYMVFFHHFIPTHFSGGFINLGYFFGEFHVGVTFFFVLSGFLIHNRYQDFGQIGLANYWKYFSSRIARIMPVFIILTTLTFLYNFFFHKADQGLAGKNIGLWLLNISLLKGFFSGLNFSGIAQAWSLTVEFCFYSFAPFLFSKVKNVVFYPLIASLLLGTGFLLVFIFSPLPLHEFFGNNRFMLSYTFFGRSFEFLVGCYLSYQINLKKYPKRKSGVLTYLGLALIFVSIYAISLFREPTIYGVHAVEGLIINNVLLPVIIIFFFKGLLLEETLISRILSGKTGQLLGKSSYAFYLIHVGFIEIGLYHFVTQHTWVLFILLNLISIFIFLWVEEPLNNYVKRKLGRLSFFKV